jgi:hypothetical protein
LEGISVINIYGGKTGSMFCRNLSNNNLTGSIPDALSQLPLLSVLDLAGNQLSGSIPSGLLKRIQDGSLDLRDGNNPNLYTNGNSCKLVKRNNKLVIYIVVPIVLVMVIVPIYLILFYLKRKRLGEAFYKYITHVVY